MAINEIPLTLPKGRYRLALVAAEFNRFITAQLVEGALDALNRHGKGELDVQVVWVPGAFELPFAADSLLASGEADAVVALGAVIRGETAHFDYVAGECARGIMEVGLKHSSPVIFGVLTTESIEQAQARAALDQGNKGFDCAMAALNMLALKESLQVKG